MTAFDPDAAAQPGSGIFGLPHGPEDAALWLIPVPFDGTTSYRRGAAEGPAAILEASYQVDLYDLQNGRAYEHGIHMAPIPESVHAASMATRALVDRMRDGEDCSAAVDEAGAEVNRHVGAATRAALAAGKIPGVVGGDHAVPYGAIAALAEHHGEIGILHVDAHADLRRDYEGFAWSHASIMDNVLQHVPGVCSIAQIGVRDFCEEELCRIQESGGRVRTCFDLDFRRRLASGERLAEIYAELLAPLPQQVYVSLDVDGLDPSLCPNTGTPVPGGLSFAELCLLLESLVDSGRRLVGFDLSEVSPGADGSEWDANVGARVLYKLSGFALRSR